VAGGDAKIGKKGIDASKILISLKQSDAQIHFFELAGLFSDFQIKSSVITFLLDFCHRIIAFIPNMC